MGGASSENDKVSRQLESGDYKEPHLLIVRR